MDIKTLEAAYYAAREERERESCSETAAEAAFLALFSSLADAKAWENAFINCQNHSHSHEWWYKELSPIF